MPYSVGMLLLLLACRDADKTPIDSSMDSEVPVVDADDDGYPDTEDCDDSDPEVNPGAEELCEPAGRDEDCDGLIDDEDSDPIGQAEWYRDEDGDGLGDPEILVSACEAPEGFVDNADDCDDTRYLGDEDLDW